MDDKYQNLRDYALKLLSLRPRSIQEIKGKLRQYSIKRGLKLDQVEKVIDELSSQNFLNDEEFTNWWIDQRRTFRPKGEKLLKMELRNKGIDKEIIDKIFTGGEGGKDRELEDALTIAQKKFPLYKNLPKEKIKMKLAGHLSRRGFSWEVIYQVIDEVLKKSYNR